MLESGGKSYCETERIGDGRKVINVLNSVLGSKNTVKKQK